MEGRVIIVDSNIKKVVTNLLRDCSNEKCTLGDRKRCRRNRCDPMIPASYQTAPNAARYLVLALPLLDNCCIL
jgi:hypothetical protein